MSEKGRSISRAVRQLLCGPSHKDGDALAAEGGQGGGGGGGGGSLGECSDVG